MTAIRARPGWRPGRVPEYVVRSSVTDNESQECTDRAVAEARAWLLRGQVRQGMP